MSQHASVEPHHGGCRPAGHAISEPTQQGRQEACEPAPTGTLNARAADPCAWSDSTSQKPAKPSTGMTANQPDSTKLGKDLLVTWAIMGGSGNFVESPRLSGRACALSIGWRSAFRAARDVDDLA